MATAGYAITIKLVGAPQATTGIAAINKSLAQLNLAGRTAIAGISPRTARASVGALGNIGLAAVGAGKLISQGVGGAVRQFVQLGGEIRGVVRELGDLAPALGPLAGLATTAGIVKTVTNFAAAGGEIQRTSGALGLNTQQLQANRIAWRLAGLSAEQFDQSFSGVSNALVQAQAGRPEGAAAIGAARQFGLHTGLPALEFIKELANKIKQLNDLKVSVVTQGGLLEAFGISRESLSLFQRGGDALADYVAQGQKLSAMDAEAAARGQALETALTGLGAAATKVGFDIADGLTGKGIVPAIEGMKNWLLELGKSPAAIQNLTNAIEGLVAVLGVLAATPILKFLIRNPLTAGAVAAIAGGVALKGVTPPEDAKKWQDEARKNKAGEAPTEFPAWWNQLRNWVFGNRLGGPKEESATAAIPPPVAAETRDSAQRTVSLLEDIRDYLKSLWPFGGVPGGATVGWPGGRPATLHRHGELGGGAPPPVSGDLSPTMRAAVAAIGGGETHGFKDPYHTLAGGGSFTGDQYPAGWRTGAGRSQFIPSTAAMEAKRLNLSDFGQHSQDWMTADYASLIYGQATGGRNFEADQASGHLDPRGRERLRQVWPGGFNEGYEERYQAATKAGIGTAPPASSPITGTAVPAPSPVTGTASPAPSPVAPLSNEDPARRAPGYYDPTLGQQGSNDSSHHVQVEFTNAPRGMRTNLATQAGDASFSLRTRYAMDSVW
jgi:muramidase (phage lysozyme)